MCVPEAASVDVLIASLIVKKGFKILVSGGFDFKILSN
jgi:hypothetical protein